MRYERPRIEHREPVGRLDVVKSDEVGASDRAIKDNIVPVVWRDAYEPTDAPRIVDRRPVANLVDTVKSDKVSSDAAIKDNVAPVRWADDYEAPAIAHRAPIEVQLLSSDPA